MHSDYEPGDEFDWDYNDDRQRCEHGTFIGSWWGPDVLCHWCESGVTADEFRQIVERREHDRLVRLATALVYDDVGPIVQSRHDQIHARPERLSEWFGRIIDEVKQTPTDVLREFVSDAR